MIVVTGGAGFIGSNLVSKLNEAGRADIIVVDDLQQGEKFANLSACQIMDYVDRNAFRKLIESKPDSFSEIKLIFHQGACTDTTEWDGRYMLDNNYTYSKELLNYAMARDIRFIYASSAAVYGLCENFIEAPANENPVNVYAYSKLLFDNYVRRLIGSAKTQIAGLRYFNVYGRGEEHKGAMSSIIFQLDQQLKKNNVLKIFGEFDGVDAGEQSRDFISVEDVVAVNLWLMENPDVSGIFNTGTGKARSFNDVASCIIDWHKRGTVEYLDFPENLKNSYQSFTEANLDKLYGAGYENKFTSLESGVHNYLSWLNG